MVFLATNVMVQLLDECCNGPILPGADHIPILISASTNLVDGVLYLLLVDFSNPSHSDVGCHAPA